MKHLQKFEGKYYDYGTAYGYYQSKMAQDNKKIDRDKIKSDFFQRYPKKSEITVEDKEVEYTLFLSDINIDTKEIIFTTENCNKIGVKEDLKISEDNSLKISILPIRFTQPAINTLKDMFTLF